MNLENFNFKFHSNVSFGQRSREILYSIINENGWEHIIIALDENLYDLPIIKTLIRNIEEQSKKVKIIICDISEPTYDTLDEKRLSLENKIDVFIGIGGGSSLDLAKALSVLYSNDGPAISYRGFDKFNGPLKPIVAVPTTAGTGSEITPNASFIDTIEKRKMGINGEMIRPMYAILDPELTISCPKAPTISSAVDSLVHATEAFVAKNSNPMARMFAKEGFKIVFENLPILVNDLESIELRENVMYGAFLSAIALMNSGTGPAAVMSYPLGVHFGVPPGIGGGIFLPHVIKHNIDSGFFDYTELYQVGNDSTTKEKKANEFIEKVWDLWQNLNVPQNLGDFGMDKGHIDSFIKDTMDLKLALDQNPVQFYEQEISKTLKALLLS